MTIKNSIRSLLIWLPSIVIALFYFPNAIEKIVRPDQLDKVITNHTLLIIVGMLLFIATALFLYDKTIGIGTAFLALYMTLIVGVHMYKGKPYEVAILIVMATIFAAYLRKPDMFYQKRYI